MQTVELLEPEDIRIIKGMFKNPGPAFFIGLAVLITAGIVTSRFMHSWMPMIGCGIFVILAAGWYLVQSSLMKTYLASGKKNVYYGILDKKTDRVEYVRDNEGGKPYENHTYFYHVDGRELVVSSELYNQFNEGDNVRVHASFTGNFVFRVTPGG